MKHGGTDHERKERPPGEKAETAGLIRRHRIFGWWSLLGFLGLGVILEAMHGFKIGWYLDVDNETRRLLLRLAHTHGTLFALVHLAFADGVLRMARTLTPGLRRASTLLIAGAVSMPGGFVLGSFFMHGGDPGPGIVIAPVGGVLVVIGVFLAAREFTAASR